MEHVFIEVCATGHALSRYQEMRDLSQVWFKLVLLFLFRWLN